VVPGRRPRAAVVAVLLLGLAGLAGLAGCGGDDEPPAKKSDGLVRAQDLSTLRPSDTQAGKSEDSAPSWPCTGAEEEVLRTAGWTMTSRTYANAAEHWALSTTLWRDDGGDAAAALNQLRNAVDLCRSKGENTRQVGTPAQNFYTYQSFGRTGQLEGERGYTTAGSHLITQVTLVGLDGHQPPPGFGDVLENSTRRAETVQQD
jgi:hypothetical protein